jgi:predicted ATP-dependent endonuclease of OLD family
MRIESLRIRNLRAIADITIQLDRRVIVLVGANNAGKTTILDALAAIVGFRGGIAFTEQDFRSTDPTRSARAAQPIEIEIEIAPSDGSRFVAGELGQQSPQIRADGQERVRLRLQTRWDADPSVAGLATTLTTLRVDGHPNFHRQRSWLFEEAQSVSSKQRRCGLEPLNLEPASERGHKDERMR